MYKLLEDGFENTTERKSISSALLLAEKKKREKSFFKYLRHEGLGAFKPLQVHPRKQLKHLPSIYVEESLSPKAKQGIIL